jgi:hypothetical protein
LGNAVESTNAFKILKHPDSHIFRCATNEEKRTFLLLIKLQSDELLALRKMKAARERPERASISKDKKDSDQVILSCLCVRYQVLLLVLVVSSMKESPLRAAVVTVVSVLEKLLTRPRKRRYLSCRSNS